MVGVTLDGLAALGEALLAGLARMRETVDAMGPSLSVPGRTMAELRQDVTRLGGLERIELGLNGRGPGNAQKGRRPLFPPFPAAEERAAGLVAASKGDDEEIEDGEGE